MKDEQGLSASAGNLLQAEPVHPSRVPFLKMQGLGNDFIVVDARRDHTAFGTGSKLAGAHQLPVALAGLDWAALARRWCDRHFGVGADGVLLVLPSEAADARMRTINADGSEAQMCGNGIRCVARYLHDADPAGRRDWAVETLAGVMRPRIHDQGVRVDMGEPIFDRARIPVAGDPARQPLRERLQVDGQEFEFSAVSMGNPHCVIVVADLAAVEFERFGPAIERHPLFPERVNVAFIQVLAPDHVRVRVWERGAGPTLACGTGACGVLAVTATLGLTARRATVSLPGGDLDIEWADDGRLYMTGPAAVAFTGTVSLA